MATKPIKIAVVTDIHSGKNSSIPARHCEIAGLLLTRAVSRLNRLIRPDVTVVLGDLVDDGGCPGTKDRLAALRAILDTLDGPYIAIPGNHDGDTEVFYQVFARPKPIEDLGGARFLPFIDEEAPGYNAHRNQSDLQCMYMAGANRDYPVVAIQHVCLRPPALAVTPYNYTNAQEIITAMKDAGVMLSVSGHYHAGAEDTRDAGVTFVNAPGLCEAPFPFTVITIDREHVRTKRHTLAMPEHL